MKRKVLWGHSPYNPGRHCSDGDSPYITGSFKNTLVRLLGIDAPEIKGLNIKKLLECGFLYVVDKQLKRYVMPKITEESIKIHKELGFKAADYFESTLQEDLLLSFGSQFLDRYGRALVYLSPSDDQDTYNLNLIKAGWAHPYFIYPNAVSPTEEGEWCYDTIQKLRDAALQAQKDNLGIWPYMNDMLLPMELRFLTRREIPIKYCADLVTNVLYSPQYYYNIPIENRLFFTLKTYLLQSRKDSNHHQIVMHGYTKYGGSRKKSKKKKEKKERNKYNKQYTCK